MTESGEFMITERHGDQPRRASRTAEGRAEYCPPRLYVFGDLNNKTWDSERGTGELLEHTMGGSPGVGNSGNPVAFEPPVFGAESGDIP